MPQPRPPNFTSLPSLLKAFQNEWDAIVLDAYTVREQLKRTREELANAVYQHDAAVRVIARLTAERNEAREALSKLTIAPTAGAGAGPGNGEAMAVDNLSLPPALQEHVDEVQQQYVASTQAWFPDPIEHNTENFGFTDYQRAARSAQSPPSGPPPTIYQPWTRLARQISQRSSPRHLLSSKHTRRLEAWMEN